MRNALFLLFACFSLLGSRRAAETETRPNVLFIVCDDLNTHVSTSGYPHIKTPTFGGLAAAGMTFGRAYCQYPVCGPSRASFLSGLYPESTGVLDNKAVHLVSTEKLQTLRVACHYDTVASARGRVDAQKCVTTGRPCCYLLIL